MSQLYRATASEGLIQHPLDSMTLIFQKSSGITHMVADPIPAILEVMAEEALTADDIAQRLSLSYDLEDSTHVADIVMARLAELHLLGLVEQV
ncbi:HPr-rel-A system PqqD family peptide chaperone [Parasphingorhabdus cellanae]|uniref:HPr-rel-A system PqqD family peptide chaperone n=1 Tax=Parasphingorhabdus cellanae TaxID=2806553 RepID=A0ABX7T6R2_9SPHN|nr:HPr-rel-A system PqqD family peptide chaperone [Parasphingorhabdus cellanae]QTD56540.1 HPr-rel-A system PqqD family peptide chaperone [Parasphingorhabdus cellanae]